MRLKYFLAFFIVFSLFGVVSSFEFNGTVYDINGVPLNNSLINITIKDNSFNILGYNSTTTNSTGWFNLTVSEPSNFSFYEPVITWRNLTTGEIEYVGQSLPSFPSDMLLNVSGTSFYLRPAGTINITAVNAAGSRVSFNYQIKDQKLGYSVAENFDFGNKVNETSIVIPRDRNYSIMIYPDSSMPVSFNWNNFSASNTYNITNTNLSNYNHTTKKLNYQFNISMNFVRVSGYLNYSGIDNWSEFTVVPYILEPGNMVHAEHGDMPYNISAMNNETDIFNSTTGFYNMTLPSTPAENSNILLFVTANKNGTYYGGFRNISSLNLTKTGFNFTNMSGLFGSADNITMDDVSNFSGYGVNISTAKQRFNLLDSSNISLNNISGHIEIEVDYSSMGAIDFTWMLDISQGGSSRFSIPLLNSTGIKEMNIFVGGENYAPKSVSYSSYQLGSLKNITITTFNPRIIGNDSFSKSNIFMGLIISNETCDIPSPSESCFIGGVGDEGLDTFNPMKSIIGGGKLSFVMGTSNIKVHYVNVDMLASGPPDALFQSSTNESTSGNFESAFRFGSQGPTIYDYALITMPYTEGNDSVTGLNESSTINISIPILYDDNWDIIWNTSVNGSNATLLAGNYSHYYNRRSEWQTLLVGTTCHENGSNATFINETNPCFINKTSNEIVLRVPHFSGTGPKITGNVITATSPSSSSGSSGSSSSGGGGSSSSVIKNTHSWTEILPNKLAIMTNFNSKIGIKKINIYVNNKTKNVKITVKEYNNKPSEISKNKTGKVNQYLHIDTENLNDILKNATVEFRVKKSWIDKNNLTKNSISIFKFNESEEVWNELKTIYNSEDKQYFYYNVTLTSFSYFAISEKILINNEIDNKTSNETISNLSKSPNINIFNKIKLNWKKSLIVFVVILIIFFLIYKKFKNKKLL